MESFPFDRVGIGSIVVSFVVSFILMELAVPPTLGKVRKQAVALLASLLMSCLATLLQLAVLIEDNTLAVRQREDPTAEIAAEKLRGCIRRTCDLLKRDALPRHPFVQSWVHSEVNGLRRQLASRKCRAAWDPASSRSTLREAYGTASRCILAVNVGDTSVFFDDDYVRANRDASERAVAIVRVFVFPSDQRHRANDLAEHVQVLHERTGALLSMLVFNEQAPDMMIIDGEFALSTSPPRQASGSRPPEFLHLTYDEVDLNVDAGIFSRLLEEQGAQSWLMAPELQRQRFPGAPLSSREEVAVALRQFLDGKPSRFDGGKARMADAERVRTSS